jgi:hypothetical protein
MVAPFVWRAWPENCCCVCGACPDTGDSVPCSWLVEVTGVTANGCGACGVWNDSFIADISHPDSYQNCLRYYDHGAEYCNIRYIAVRVLGTPPDESLLVYFCKAAATGFNWCIQTAQFRLDDFITVSPGTCHGFNETVIPFDLHGGSNTCDFSAATVKVTSL